MANLEVTPTMIRCGRTADGRFAVQTVMPVGLPNGEQILAPVQTFVLDAKEEAEWRAMLSGVLVPAVPSLRAIQ